jgi:hypothetical protein
MTKLRTKLAVVAGFALLSLAPAFGSACEYDAATSASAAPPAQLAAAPAPEASRAPTSNATSSALKAPVPKRTAKEVVGKSKEAPRSNVKVAALTAN